jgi:hypothetical protein
MLARRVRASPLLAFEKCSANKAGIAFFRQKSRAMPDIGFGFRRVGFNRRL